MMRCNYCGLDDHDHHCRECGRSLVGKHPCECAPPDDVPTLQNLMAAPMAMDFSDLGNDFDMGWDA